MNMEENSNLSLLLPRNMGDILEPGEEVMIIAMQKRIGFGGALIDPKLIVVTDKRIIISKFQELGLKVSYEFIPFENIFSVRMEHGIASTAIVLTTWSRNDVEATQRIDGLRYKDALNIFNYLEKKIVKNESKEGPETQKIFGAYVYCPVCGARNDINAKYCSNCGAKL